MMTMRASVSRSIVAAVVILLVVGAALAQAPTPQSHEVPLSGARVSVLLDRQIVISMDATGTLPGLLTLTLAPVGSDGAVGSGEWALVVTYFDPSQGVLVDRGTLAGSVDGGTLALGADGTPTALIDLRLTVIGGSMTFRDVWTGAGAMEAVDLQQARSAGVLHLAF